MKASNSSRERAAQAWCTEKTKNKEMDVVLAEAFAEILEDVWSKAWLGNATTGELIEELKARSNLNYRTTRPTIEELERTLSQEPATATTS